MAADGSIRIEVELDDGQVISGLADISDQFDRVQRDGNSAFDKLGKSIKVFAVGAGAALGGLGLAAGALGVAINSFVDANRELNTDLARLRTNAEVAGFGVNVLEENLLKVAAVSGELDSAVETVSQLAATDFSENQLAEALDYINGAAIKFSDTLNTEGIADGLQETFAVGEAAGQFGELLERSGINLDDFNKQLAKAEKQGTATDFVLQTLAETGLGDTYAAYLESNKAITEYNEAQVRSEVLTAQLAERLTPLATQYTVLKNTIIDVILGNQQLSAVFDLLGNNIANLLSKLTGIDVSTFLDAFEQIKITVQTALDIVVDTSQRALSFLRSLWAENGDEISKNTSKAFETIRKVIENVLNAVVPFVSEQVNKIKDFWNENGEQILQAVTNAFNGIKAVIDFVMPAILFVVEYVWNAIQNVVTGALGLIMGAIQVFSGLLTGDFSKMWEGIVTVFKGAFDLILGILSVTFIGGIRSALTNLSKTAIEIVKNKWTTIVSIFKNFGTQAATATGSLVTNVLKFFQNLFTNGVAAIRSLQSGVTTQFTTLATNAINAIKGLPARFTQYGRDTINGFVNGIKEYAKNAVAAVSGVINGVINTATSLLDIHSPSRVFKEIGLFTGDGLVVGLNSSSANVNKAMESVLDGILEVSNDYQKEYQKLLDDNSKENIKKNKEINDKISKIESTAAKKKRKLTSDEIKQIAKIKKDGKDAELKAEEKAYKYLLSVTEKSEKDYLNVLKSYIEDKKSLNELSLVEEAAILEQSIQLFIEGSAQRIAVQKEYQKALEAIQNKINDTNENYLKKIADADKRYLDESQKIRDNYVNEFEKAYTKLFNFTSTFEDYAIKYDKSGEQLIESLQNQVFAIRYFEDYLDKLSVRGLNEDILGELRELGPKALPELVALNSLTEEQLDKYNDLYKEKQGLVNRQVIDDLEKLRKDTEVQLYLLERTYESELTSINEVWDKEIKALLTNTQTNLSSLTQIGRDAGQGLLNGLKALEGPLKAQAQRMADSITKTIEKALDINSPSRWASDYVVGNIEKGFEVGVQKNEKGFAAASAEISEAIKIPLVNPLRNTSLSGTTTASSATNTNTTNNVFNNKTENLEANINIVPANVILDKRQVGQIIYSEVDKNQYRATAISAYTQGVNFG